MYSKTTTIFCAILFFTIAHNALAQRLKLTVNNPAPRIGDELAVSYNIDGSAHGMLGIGAVSMMPAFLADKGPVTIGPIAITLNGVLYTSDSLVLHVAQPLPAGIKDGVWIRKVESNGVAYIIVEQRFEVGSNKKLAELNVDKIKKRGILVELEGAQLSTQSTLTGTVQYRISIHRFGNVAQSKMIELERTFFTNLPENVFFE
ncbi:hypothetical protein [Pseudochryseolinea flava]|uniref:Uncharacterized protein n=1 Tax=Pseudochryseolinea flava TaxID=2059302 RepID=A0A364XX08_9BACT|nr:hypothetical protein [Pseudochryseolinea flava]RAV98958.1 hypothetical protein DQQ10_21930 [Pseudochryseolinea flava]